MSMRAWGTGVLLLSAWVAFAADGPGPLEDGYALPNGWKLSPTGTSVATEDTLMDLTAAPDGRAVVAVHAGYNPHGLVVIDPATKEAVQRIALPTAWHGLAWSPDGARIFVSGGNNRDRDGKHAPIYVFEYADGRLSEEPVAKLEEPDAEIPVYWAGLAHHPEKPVLYAANQVSGEVVAIDTASGEIRARVKVEEAPYDLVLDPDGATLYVSNWASDTVSFVDTERMAVITSIGVGDNPNDMVLAPDGRLFVACANDNTVLVIDSERRRAVETVVTSLHERAPEGSTPNALALDPAGHVLFVANADNNNVCVVDVAEAGESTVLGFIPAGWYPSALAVTPDGATLCIGNSKGSGGSYHTLRGPHSPLRNEDGEGRGSVKSLMKGSVDLVNLEECRGRMRELTEKAYANCPYNDDLLARARPASGPSVVPRDVGAESPIKHVIYIIKENRTYDQVFGDLPQGNGDPRLCIFGREVTPNHHALAEQFVLLDNLYCDAEVSRDGHQWSNAAYATDYIEKTWPAGYGGKSDAPRTQAIVPGSGYLWDQCRRKGLTFRSYGEQAARASESGPMEAIPEGLRGHVSPDYLSWGARDYENAAVFIREFDEYERNYDSKDPNKRLPRFIVMALPEDHTKGTRPGVPTPRAAVASNDYGLGLIVDRVTHSRYWPETAIFVIEDDAQDGPDHVDARRTVGLVLSPYSRNRGVDSTFYTTSSMLRTIELLLGLQPMSQFDAAANPMYACFGTELDPTPYEHLEPTIDIHELNTATAWGARESMEMDFSDYDRTPMFALNEIVWKSVRGADSEMPLPVHRFTWASLE